MASTSLLTLVGLVTTLAGAGSAPPPALVATDALGRALPEPGEVRPFRADRHVGLFYFLWLKTSHVYDNSRILAAGPGVRQDHDSPPWGPPGAFHFWGEPLYGYYRSDDPWVLRRHALLLADAGVDFLIFDTTNALIYEDTVQQLGAVFDELRRAGETVPQFAFMVNSRAGDTARRIYERLYRPGRYRELWFHWRGKPLLLCDPNEADPEVAAFFTLRTAHWPFTLVNTRREWHWEATYPQVYGYDTDPARPEQVSVSVGQNLHQITGQVAMMSSGRARGRSYHDGRQDDRPEAYRHGFNFAEQWQRALELDPEVVFVTGWNEWIAQQLNRQPDGPPVFCDQYDLEFSRDVEMMRGGYGDATYLQMAAAIRRFKGMRPAEPASPPRRIDLNGPWSQWDEVRPRYRDHALDTLPRDHPGCGRTHYRVTSGRNDLRICQVTYDAEQLYFHVRAAADLSPPTGPNWMWLLIGVDDPARPAWEGFQVLVNRRRTGDTETSVERCTGAWTWEPIGRAAYRAQGSHLHLSLPRALLGLGDAPPRLRFKWIDNSQTPGDILDAYTHGDTAPEGRFAYRYAPVPTVTP